MKDPKLVREKITNSLDLMEIMLEYNTQFKHSPRVSEETQYRCPFHGTDNKPSARLFKSTNSCYCWYCKKSWDSFSFIMEKEGLKFSDTVRLILSKYKIDLSDIPDGPKFELKKKDAIISEDVIDFIYVRNKILGFRKKIKFDKYRALCTAYYMILFDKSKGKEFSSGLSKLKSKLNTI